ncbi:hypothetical protein C8Q75DRAFT_155093 [Abortiporus biennis]|nr:hypothetical protein C8Q75DRAFT_155093 [Abortiporus biennis]
MTVQEAPCSQTESDPFGGNYFLNKLCTYDLAAYEKLLLTVHPTLTCWRSYVADPRWVSLSIKTLIASKVLKHNPGNARIILEWLDESAAVLQSLQGCTGFRKKYVGARRFYRVVDRIGPQAVKWVGEERFFSLWSLIVVFERQLPGREIEAAFMVDQEDTEVLNLAARVREQQHLHNYHPPHIDLDSDVRDLLPTPYMRCWFLSRPFT